VGGWGENSDSSIGRSLDFKIKIFILRQGRHRLRQLVALGRPDPELGLLGFAHPLHDHWPRRNRPHQFEVHPLPWPHPDAACGGCGCAGREAEVGRSGSGVAP